MNTEKSQPSETGSLYLIALIIGSAALSAFVVLLFLHDAFLQTGTGTLDFALYCRLFFLFGLTLVMYIFPFKQPALWLTDASQRMGQFGVLLIALLLVPILVLVRTFTDFGEVPLFISWGLAGFAFGVSLITWNSMWTVFYHAYLGKHTFLSILGAVCVMTVLCFSTLFAPPLVCVSLVIVFGTVALIGLWVCTCSKPNFKRQDTQSVSRFQLPWRAVTHVAGLGMFFGYSTGYAISCVGSSTVLFILLPVVLFAGIAIFSMSKVLKWPLSFAFAGRIAFPTSVFGLLFIWLPDPSVAATIQFVFATAGCSFFIMYHWSFISHWSVRYGVLPLAQAAFGMVAPISGTFAGWGLFCLFVFLGIVNNFVATIFALLFLFAYILITAIMPYGSELRIVDAERSIEEHPHDGTSIWKSSLRHIATNGSLTPREREIFALLARGRNVRYISEHLVISDHTAKSHVYRIYSKLSINSQQELISLAENYASEIRDIDHSKSP